MHLPPGVIVHKENGSVWWMDLDKICGDHFKQREAIHALLTDPAQFQLWRCSRRAAKTTGIALTAAHIATEEDGTNQIYAALTRGQAKEAMWRTTWKPFIARELGDEKSGGYKHNETNQQTMFANGSSVAFGGLDDLKHIQTFLGQKLRAFYADESQGAASSLLKALVEDVIGPALSDDTSGKFLMAGMLPDVPTGYYYDAITKGKWLCRNWNRFDNPFLKEDQHKALAKYLEATGLTIDSPETRRRWFGELVFDPGATAYRYSKEKNAYVPPPWQTDGFRVYPALGGELLDSFSVGIDPGAHDRTAIVVVGWNEKNSRDVWVVHEWVSPRDSGMAWSTIGAQLSVIEKMFAPGYWYYDAGGSKLTLDLFSRDFAVPVVNAAEKSDLRGQVDRASDLLGQGRLHVIDGSALERDLQLTRWDQDARAEGQFKWSSDNHPDVADAMRYALGGYFYPGRPLPKEKPEDHLQRAERKFREDFAPKSGGSNYGYGGGDGLEPSVDPSRYGGPR
jgi:hypothetical protein